MKEKQVGRWLVLRLPEAKAAEAAAEGTEEVEEIPQNNQRVSVLESQARPSPRPTANHSSRICSRLGRAGSNNIGRVVACPAEPNWSCNLASKANYNNTSMIVASGGG